MKYRKRIMRNIIASIPLIALCLVFILPIVVLITGALTDTEEWLQRLRPMLENGEGFITWRWMPDYPTGENFKRLLFYSPGFLKLFWNSIGMVAVILAGQFMVGVPAAWAFAVFSFRGRRFLFQIYMILMLLPFQVTMLSKYLVLSQLRLLDTRASVILPAVFSTFPVFLVYRSFIGIPMEISEAARIDGAGEGRIFWQMGIPLAKGGILACLVLSFLESWNMMEEPLAFLKNKAIWPLSLYLPEISMEQAGFAASASVITLIVSMLVFGLFRDSLEKGIAASGVK